MTVVHRGCQKGHSRQEVSRSVVSRLKVIFGGLLVVQ
jgi:hypothetical protein